MKALCQLCHNRWDQVARTKNAIAKGDDVAIGLGIEDVDGKPITIWLRVDPTDARAFARSVLRCAGDATERTFPRPREAADVR